MAPQKAREDSDAPVEAFWSDRTLRHAAIIWELQKADAKWTARAQRIIFDKNWHSRNRAKADASIDITCELCREDNSLKHLLVECQHFQYKKIRDKSLATIRHDLSYNKNMECRGFAELLYILIFKYPERRCMYTRMWTLELRNRLREMLKQLNTTFSRKKLEEWKKILVQTGQTLTIAARSMNGLRFQDQEELPKHTRP